MFRVLAVADTHLRNGQASRLTDRLLDHLSHVDVIVHAGDIVEASVLEELARYAPVVAVRGNNDVAADLQSLPETIVRELGGCEVAVVHDSGASSGRTRRLRRLFPTADVVIFGHSHIPWHEIDVDPAGHVQHHINPGSAIQARRQPACTAAVIDLDLGSVTAVRTVTLNGKVRHTIGIPGQV